ncbi:hypothetical protein ED208_12555 [Stagnimonas aquatica]|uniref:Uncharacterized protein n=1 Tax=Stagnimonas aquatica TaxID=2689987 RepID=A0A3N0V7E5_9GAMM|nr:hypothetical protein [Stagnimonas aquatica]ROH88643.1 hypothetical protein ED208_12555 [Stagnimonas aquatica]
MDALDERPRFVDLDVDQELRGAIVHAIREALNRQSDPLSRERIADRMNQLLPGLRHRITERRLNSWTAKSKEYSEFPARFIPAFCAAVECDEPLRVLARALRQDVVDAHALAAKSLGENLIQDAALKTQRRLLLTRLGA